MAGEAFATDKPKRLGCVYSMPTIKGVVFPLVRTSCVCCVYARACACVLMHSRRQPKLVVSHNVGFCCIGGHHKLCHNVWLK